MKNGIRTRVGVLAVVCSAAVMFITPGMALASTSSSSAAEVTAAVNKYANGLAANYTTHGSQPANSLEQELVEQTTGEISTAKQHGLNVTHATVTPQVVAVAKNTTGYSVTADLTTSLNMTAKSGTTITLLGRKTDHLDSSATDRHDLQLTRETGANNYSVTADSIQQEQNSDADQTKQLSAGANSAPSALSDRSKWDSSATQSTFGTNSVGVNYITEMKYADTWTDNAHQNKMNPDFPDDDDNCTNFVSQSLYAAGLKTTYGNSFQTKDTSVWTWNLAGIAGQTWTWDNANYNYTYMKDHSKTFTHGNNPDIAWEGSLLYGDWGRDGKYNHAMVVVGDVITKNSTTPVIDQKSPNRHDYLFSDSKANAVKEYKKVSWGVLQYKYN
ncbi:amidase domain-containing protein [uncultured Bifidobacterium sp.]|uniref:amidase domain-containing protein n=1 Tax=uncultured Bifidobacterium sp. TaxID=165187 RepID=UPI00261734AE|nr:amidase domain-containing protein [uncultured Bifidobacterium sp.]